MVSTGIVLKALDGNPSYRLDVLRPIVCNAVSTFGYSESRFPSPYLSVLIVCHWERCGAYSPSLRSSAPTATVGTFIRFPEKS